MASEAGQFTRWAALAAGEGGGRVASQFFARSENPGIDDRIFVINTNRSDIRNTIQRMQEQMQTDEEDDLFGQFALDFGSTQGVGNNFALGKEAAQSDLNRIVEEIKPRFTGSDAILYITTLGGGTGNGSVPYLINEFKRGLSDDLREEWMSDLIHAAFAIWPYYYEPPQRHFNAVCGLSRLLRRSGGGQNADMVVLAANSHIDDSGGQGGDFGT
ncbi:MAG: hypothetical protein ABEI52_00095, partial [Halobacteriaceae archaeon]